MAKKNLLVILEGIVVVGLLKSDVFILSYHVKRSGIVFNNQYELIILRICTHSQKLLGFILTQ